MTATINNPATDHMKRASGLGIYVCIYLYIYIHIHIHNGAPRNLISTPSDGRVEKCMNVISERGVN